MTETFSLSPIAERLRTVFLSKDAQGFWEPKLSSHDIDLLRTAAASTTTWFLLVAAEKPPLQLVFAHLRPHLILAAVSDFTTAAIHAPCPPDDPRYELDPGPPLGYPGHSHPFRLLGKDPSLTESHTNPAVANSSKATTGLLAFSQTQPSLELPTSAQVLPDTSLYKPPPPQPCAPSTPVVPPSSPTSPGSPTTLLSLLGAESATARNVVALQNLRVLRHRAQAAVASYTDGRAADPSPSITTQHGQLESAKLKPKLDTHADDSTVSKPGTHRPESHQDITLIFNTAKPNPASLADAPPASKIRASTALILAHSGFTHTSSIALDILADTAVQFIEQLGQSLSACRNVSDDIRPTRRDQDGIPMRSTDQFVEEMRRISTAGFRGGFPALQHHARGDMLRNEQALREADRRIREQLHNVRQASPVSGIKRGLHPAPQARQDRAGPVKQEYVEQSDTKGEYPVAMSTSKPEEAGEETEAAAVAMNVQLDTEAFAFGYLSRKVHLDVLNGVRVPRRLVYGARSIRSDPQPSPGREVSTVTSKRKRFDGNQCPDPRVRVKLEAKAVEASIE